MATVDEIALVHSLLPEAALLEYGWTDLYIDELMVTNAFTPTEAVRFFWLERVNETAEYLDTSKPLTQIHRQAKEMLAYWDNILAKYGDSSIGPPGGTDAGMPRKPMTFGVIERPFV